eukprot:gb/GEZJ01000098.1/.p1 GENE.gb/GEZJ01000098.1/~~gb/GEZJ01000098.1/.p1  ORF type:complete len:345 (-),score=17.43 gb/GEZJ01000098.1/:7035-8069(-)
MAIAQWKDTQYQRQGTIITPNKVHTARTIPRKLHKSKTTSTTKHKPKPKQQSKNKANLSSKTEKHKPSTTLPITEQKTKTATVSEFQKMTNPTQSTPNSSMQLATHQWHLKMNHSHPQKLANTAPRRLIPLMPTTLSPDTQINCTACHSTKLHPAPHKRKENKYPTGTYVSSGTCSPMKPTSTHGNNHMLLIVCASNKVVIAHFVKDRKDISTHISATLHHLKHKMQHPLTDIRSDNAKEYTIAAMQDIYTEHSLQHHLSTPHQPQENSIAERLNITIMKSARALLSTAQLHHTYWEDAARDTVFKYNLLHHATTETSSYQLWYGQTPQLKYIYTFGELGTIPA